MRFGIAGKGGVGKTTITAVLSRALARQGHRVIAIDCDSDPNLAANMGVDDDEVGRMLPFLHQSADDRSLPSQGDARHLLETYGLTGPDGVTLLLGARVERAGSG